MNSRRATHQTVYIYQLYLCKLDVKDNQQKWKIWLHNIFSQSFYLFKREDKKVHLTVFKQDLE